MKRRDTTDGHASPERPQPARAATRRLAPGRPPPSLTPPAPAMSSLASASLASAASRAPTHARANPRASSSSSSLASPRSSLAIAPRGATAARGAIMSPTLESATESSPGAGGNPVKLVAVVPGGARAVVLLPYPPGLPETHRSGGPGTPGPDWMEVMSHMALRLSWTDPGFAMDVFAHDADLDLIAASAADADVFVVLDVKDDRTCARLAAELLAGVPTGAASGAAPRWRRRAGSCSSR